MAEFKKVWRSARTFCVLLGNLANLGHSFPGISLLVVGECFVLEAILRVAVG